MKRVLLAVLVGAFIWACPAWAQNGGKAEPKRIEFKKGAYSGSISDSISGDVEAEYAFGARKGQKITVVLTSTPARSATFELLDPGFINLNEGTNGFSFSTVATETGDFQVNVTRLARAPRTVKFKLTVTIK